MTSEIGTLDSARTGQPQTPFPPDRVVALAGCILCFAGGLFSLLDSVYNLILSSRLSSQTLTQLANDNLYLLETVIYLLLCVASLVCSVCFVAILRRQSPLWAYLAFVLNMTGSLVCLVVGLLPVIIRLYIYFVGSSRIAEDLTINFDTLSDSLNLVAILGSAGGAFCLGLATWGGVYRNRWLAGLFLLMSFAAIVLLFTFKTDSSLNSLFAVGVYPALDLIARISAGFWFLSIFRKIGPDKRSPGLERPLSFVH